MIPLSDKHAVVEHEVRYRSVDRALSSCTIRAVDETAGVRAVNALHKPVLAVPGGARAAFRRALHPLSGWHNCLIFGAL